MAYSAVVSPRKARRLPAEMPRKPRGGLPRQPPGGAAGGPGAVEDGGPGPPAGRAGPEWTEERQDRDWTVRAMPGSATVKSYRCPGCDQEITPGTAHLVVWPAGAPGAEERRHWHSGCWSRGLRPSGRRPGRR